MWGQSFNYCRRRFSGFWRRGLILLHSSDCGIWQRVRYNSRFAVICCLRLRVEVIRFWCDSPHVDQASSFTRFLDHTQRRPTVGRTPLDEWLVRSRDLYLTTYDTHNWQTSICPPPPPRGIRTQSQQASGRRPTLGWVHTCNVTAYRNTVSWRCGRNSGPRKVSKVGYAVPLRACSVCCRYLVVAIRDDTVMAGAGVDVQRDVWCPPRLLFNGHRRSFHQGESGRGTRLNINLYLMSRLRTSGVIPPVPYTPSRSV
jgi:hypothetical protein